VNSPPSFSKAFGSCIFGAARWLLLRKSGLSRDRIGSGSLDVDSKSITTEASTSKWLFELTF
jgi:hypothetical protein